MRDQVGIPAMIRALKEKAPFWAEKLPELPELFYDSLQQHKLLQQSVDKLTNQMQAQRVRQGQSLFVRRWRYTVSKRYDFAVGGRRGVSHALMAAGIVSWVIGWKRTT